MQKLGIALGLALKQRLWQTRKWSIAFVCTPLPTLSYNDQHSRAKNAVNCCVRLHVESDNVMTISSRWQSNGPENASKQIAICLLLLLLLLLLLWFCFVSLLVFSSLVMSKRKEKEKLSRKFHKKKYAK